MKTTLLTLSVTLSALPALADAGLHHHPHGISLGWIIAAAVLAGGPVLAVALKRAKK